VVLDRQTDGQIRQTDRSGRTDRQTNRQTDGTDTTDHNQKILNNVTNLAQVLLIT
jgi:hypothetical protein